MNCNLMPSATLPATDNPARRRARAKSSATVTAARPRRARGQLRLPIRITGDGFSAVELSLSADPSLTLRAVQLSPRQVRGEVDMNPPNSAFDRRGQSMRTLGACWCLRTHEHPND